MSDVIVTLPGADAPGFLKRVRKSKALIDRFDGAVGPGETMQVWEEVAAYLVSEGYVTAPEGVDVQEALAEMSQNDLRQIIWGLAGISVTFNKPVSEVDPPNAA